MPAPAVAAVAAVKGVGSAISGSQSARAARRAAETEAQARERALELQRQMFERQVELQEPFRQAGITSQNELMRQFGLAGDETSAGYGNLLRDFGAADFQADPGYGFRLAEGTKALERVAAARGGLLSGGAIKAGQRYAQDLAANEYQNAYNRYQQNRLARYNMLSGQQGVGMGAASNVGNAAQNYGQQGGQQIVGAGQARASGYLNAQEARNAMIGGLTNIGADLAGYYGSNPAGQSMNVNPYNNPGNNALFNRLVG